MIATAPIMKLNIAPIIPPIKLNIPPMINETILIKPTIKNRIILNMKPIILLPQEVKFKFNVIYCADIM